MTRTTDETLSHKERVKRILNAFGNRDDDVISNHINAGGECVCSLIYKLFSSFSFCQILCQLLVKLTFFRL